MNGLGITVGEYAAEKRSAQFLAELEAVESMSPEELRAECKKIAGQGGFTGMVAAFALDRYDNKNREPQPVDMPNLQTLTDDEIAGRVMDESLPQSAREAAMVEFKRRGLLRKRRAPRQRNWNRA